MTAVHAFTDDALGSADATEIAALIAGKEITRQEATEAAISRAERMQPLINAVEVADYDRARRANSSIGPFAGVPVFIKDNVDVAGLPTNQGSAAYRASPATKDSAVVGAFRTQGFNILGKSRLPEFGLNASTEYEDREPVRNPWNPAYSAGASSGGAAALVAAGVVPLAHANDGGGSIRIPAAACGLVGLKPTRGRLVEDAVDKLLPVRIVSQGIVTRSVRDTANFYAAAETQWRNTKLPPIGDVQPGTGRRLRVGLVLDSVTGTPTDAETRDCTERTAALLADLGHTIEEAPIPVSTQFAEDFALYWAVLALLISTTGTRLFDKDFDATRTDSLTQGLARTSRNQLWKVPAAIHRLRRSTTEYRALFTNHDVVLSPVLGHPTPEIGHLSPSVEFDEVFDRLKAYVGFTPLNNATGGPAISLPIGRTSLGLPLACHFSADLGDERTLLEVAYELEGASPWSRIEASPSTSSKPSTKQS